MSRESRMASRAGSRCGSAIGYDSNMASGYTTPNFYSNNNRPDSASSNQELRSQHARNSIHYKQPLCKGLNGNCKKLSSW